MTGPEGQSIRNTEANPARSESGLSAIRQIVMPKLGLTMTEGMVSEWPTAKGQRFERGAIYLVVETDKVANEIEAPEAGTIVRILVPQGETVPVGTVLAEWEAEASEAKPVPATVSAQFASRVAESRRRRASSVELITAKRLTEAKQSIPHFYLSTEFEVSRLQSLRAGWNARSDRPRVTLTHLLVVATARALAKHPELNRVWDGDGFIEFDSVDIGVAVDTEHGLLAPVVRGAHGMNLAELARELGTLVGRARAMALTAADIGGSAITVSNAGMHDVTWMASIINPGQAAILGVGSERKVFRPDEQGTPRLAREICVVLSCDHRVLDGVKGIALLNEVRSILERPEALFTLGEDH